MSLDALRTQGLPDQFATDIVAALAEVGRLKFSVASGAGTNSNITVTGITTGDTLVAVIQFDLAADTGTSATGNKVQAVASLTAEAAITGTDHIQCTTTTTTGDTLLVVWFKKT